MTWSGVRDHKTAVCGTNLASRQVLFGFPALTGNVFRFFFFHLPASWEIFSEMPRFQLSNEKSDLALWGPSSQMATLVPPFGGACDLAFARAPPLH